MPKCGDSMVHDNNDGTVTIEREGSTESAQIHEGQTKEDICNQEKDDKKKTDGEPR